MQKISQGIVAESGLRLVKALRKGHTHTEATGLRSCVPSRHAESLWGHAAESGLPLAKALQKGHTHTEAAGLRPRVLSRLL